MNLQLLYHEYLNQKFNRGLSSVPLDDFEYGILEEDGALFFIERKDVAFVEWAYELPRSPLCCEPGLEACALGFSTIWTSMMNWYSFICYLRSTRQRPS